MGWCKRNILQIWRNLGFTNTTHWFSFSRHLSVREACGWQRNKSALNSRGTVWQCLERILLISGVRNSSFTPWDYSCFWEDSGQRFGRLPQQWSEIHVFGQMIQRNWCSRGMVNTVCQAEGQDLYSVENNSFSDSFWWRIYQHGFISVLFF